MSNARLRARTAGRLAALALVGALALSACGDQGGAETADDGTTPTATETTTQTPTETPSEPGATDEGELPEPTEPACSSIWVAGQDLPKRYQGCFDEERGRWLEAMAQPCSSGQHLVTFRRNFYAAKGDVINETRGPLARDKEFQKALAACGA